MLKETYQSIEGKGKPELLSHEEAQRK